MKEYSIFERIWALPTFEIHGIRGGFVGDGAKTVIPAQATAKVSLRLVPGQRYAKVARQLERAVEALAPRWAEVKVTILHGGDAVQVDIDHPAFEVLDEAFESVAGRKAVRVRAGGSIPIVPELGLAGAPVILTGIGLPDDGLHSPNEKLDLAQLWSGIQIFGRFFELFAEKGGSKDGEVKDGEEGRGAGARGDGLELVLRGHRFIGPEYLRLGARVQLIDADERPRRRDDPRHDVVGPVGVGALAGGEFRGAVFQIPDRGGNPLVLRRSHCRPGASGAELQLLQRLEVGFHALR